jgi:hypothetical protein
MMKGPTKAKMIEKGPTKEKNEEKGAYKGQNKGNRPSKKFLAPQISKKCLGPTRALIRPCLGSLRGSINYVHEYMLFEMRCMLSDCRSGTGDLDKQGVQTQPS